MSTHDIDVARAQKAIILLDYLRDNLPETLTQEPEAVAKALLAMGDPWWEGTAQRAGVRVPSETTRQVVAELWVKRPPTVADPFEGLAS